jgi:hypothetical protein
VSSPVFAQAVLDAYPVFGAATTNGCGILNSDTDSLPSSIAVMGIKMSRRAQDSARRGSRWSRREKLRGRQSTDNGYIAITRLRETTPLGSQRQITCVSKIGDRSILIPA